MESSLSLKMMISRPTRNVPNQAVKQAATKVRRPLHLRYAPKTLTATAGAQYR